MGKRAILLVALVCVAGAVGCGSSAPRVAAEGPLALDELSWATRRDDTNLVLIVADTTRRDRMGIYGGGADTVAFDAFARDSLLFDAAYAQSPWTKPSMATLFTGLYPSQHGVVSHPSLRSRQGIEIKEADVWMDVMGDEYVTLAEVLRDGGLRTAAFVGNPWLKREFGFAQGFDAYDDSFADWEVPGHRLTEAALEWLGEQADAGRFFLYLHYMDAHRPYGTLSRAELEAATASRGRSDATRDQDDADSGSDPATVSQGGGAGALPEAIRAQIAPLVLLDDGTPAAEAGFEPSIELLTMAYDRGIESFDAALGELLQGLRALPAWDRTAVVILSDHGEALYTRGWGNHGGGLYEDEVAVPLAARLPGVTAEGGVVGTPVGLVDILPTLVTYLGIEPTQDAPAFGRSWLAPATGEDRLADRYLVSEGVMFRPNNRAIWRRGYKALWQPHVRSDDKERALFHLATDPAERRDLIAGDAETEAVETFNDLLRGAREEVVAYKALGPQYMPLDPQLERRLRALGYIGG